MVGFTANDVREAFAHAGSGAAGDRLKGIAESAANRLGLDLAAIIADANQRTGTASFADAAPQPDRTYTESRESDKPKAGDITKISSDGKSICVMQRDGIAEWRFARAEDAAKMEAFIAAQAVQAK